MKYVNAFIIIVLFIMSSCTKHSQEIANTKKLKHVVLLKFKDQVSKDSITVIENAFADLPNKINEIKDLEWGTNNSPEGLNKGFTHAFILTFDSEKGRELYLPHLDHKAFVEILTPVLEDVLVIDYWAN